MKYKVLFLMFISIVLDSIAQNPNWAWVNTFGNISQDHGRTICCDNNGDVYIAGSYALEITMGSFVLPDEDCDIYVAKMNSNGNYIWANHAFGSTSVFVNSICNDQFGNVYITGYYEGGHVTFGQFEIQSSGYSYIFVAKLDYSGNWLWAQNAGGDYYDEGLGITADQAGDIYITGYFRGTSYFGNHSITSSGDWSIFIAKLNTNGIWQWVTGPVGCGGYDISYDIGSAMNDVFITGYFSSDTINFGSSTLTLTNHGHADIFVARIDSSGNWIWAQQSTGDDNDISWALSVNSEGMSVISGEYSSNNITFGNHSLESANDNDIFVAKLDSNGNWIGATSANGIGYDASSSVFLTSDNRVYTTGLFQDMAQFGEFSLSTIESNFDVFVGELDSNGNWEWVIQAGGLEYDAAYDLTSFINEEIYVIGDFQDTATFGQYTVTSTDSFFDVFVLKLCDQVSVHNLVLNEKERTHISNYSNPFNPSTTIF